MTKMPSFKELAWATFLFRVMEMNEDYINLLQEREFLNRLRNNPQQLGLGEIGEKLLKGFLNKWRCRVENNARSRQSVKEALQDLKIDILQGERIETITFQEKESSIIMEAYSRIRSIGYGFGPTATSKLLHLLNTNLFVMLDRKILDEYRQYGVNDTGKGYVIFLKKMKQLAERAIKDFNSTYPSENLASYLSHKFGYNPPISLAKYLDEYNWIVITNEITLPPSWHPCNQISSS